MTEKSGSNQLSLATAHILGQPPRPPYTQHKNYAKWRSFTLLSIYLLFVVHIIHWQLNDTTLAPLELNELLYTLESGIVTAGFLLMALAAVSVVIFGRFFCGWFCHILALQDLCAWLLAKIGLRPKAIRSRILWLVPFWVMAYMFIWPQIVRLWQGRAFLQFKIAAAQSDWASFITDDFWRNLPDPWIATATFLVCGFIIVYVLGSRGFCANVCPYGAIFAIADKIAPGKIIVSGDCDQCGICTAQCDSHVRIHEEIAEFGKVVDTNCLKDLDCVSVCPKQALSFGFTKPTLFTKNSQIKRKKLHPHFTLIEELIISLVFIMTVMIYRGLYDSVPFFMSLGMAAILSYLSIVTMRVFSSTHLRFNRLWLRQNNHIQTAGWVFLAMMLVFLLFTLHSGMIRWHEYVANNNLIKANYLIEQGQIDTAKEASAQALKHFEFVQNWGLFHSLAHTRKLASSYALNAQPESAKKYYHQVLADNPNDLVVRWKVVQYLLSENKIHQARFGLLALTDNSNHNKHINQAEKQILAMSHTILGNLHMSDNEPHRALIEYQSALDFIPDYPAALQAVNNLNRANE